MKFATKVAILKQNKCFQVSTRKFNFKQYFYVCYFLTHIGREMLKFSFFFKDFKVILISE